MTYPSDPSKSNDWTHSREGTHITFWVIHSAFCLFVSETILKIRLSLIVRVNVVLNRTVVVDSD